MSYFDSKPLHTPQTTGLSFRSGPIHLHDYNGHSPLLSEDVDHHRQHDRDHHHHHQNHHSAAPSHQSQQTFILNVDTKMDSDAEESHITPDFDGGSIAQLFTDIQFDKVA